MNFLLEHIKTLKTYQGVVGIHIGIGGDFANCREYTRWIKKVVVTDYRYIMVDGIG